MRGSRIAKEIEQEMKREQARRELLLRELRKRRGESNEFRRINIETTNGVDVEGETDTDKY